MPMSCPIPGHPHEIGVEEIHSDLSHIEGAHLLANASRGFLKGCGFDDDQILEWAETYIAEKGSGTVRTFIAWIHECEAA